MVFEEYAAEKRPAIDSRLSEILHSAGSKPAELFEAMRYSVLNGGKRFRPFLCMASCEAVGGNPDSVIDAACAIELVHCFSLVHDDLPSLDNDDLRRGLPSCHAKFGEAIALLAGDALFCLAFEVMSNIHHDKALRSVQILAGASGTQGMVGGQTMDILSEGRSVSRDDVEWIHTRKTGALIAASCEIGALLGGGAKEERETCVAIGQEVGLGFQVADDLLNVLATTEATGKRSRSDEAKGKATYPGLVGLEQSEQVLREGANRVEGLCSRLGKEADGLRAVALHAFSRSN